MLANDLNEVNSFAITVMAESREHAVRQGFPVLPPADPPGVAKDKISSWDFRRMKTQLEDRQAGKTLIDYVSDSALFLSAKSVANNCEVKFFLFGKVVIRGIGHRHCFVTLFLEDELPSSTEDL